MEHFVLEREEDLVAFDPEEEAREAMRKLNGLAYEAAERMEKMMADPKVPEKAKLMVATIVLDRVFGKPETMLKIQGNERQIETSKARIQRIVEENRAKWKNETLEHLKESGTAADEK